MRHHRDRAAGRARDGVHARPDALHARVEDLPALALGRRVVRREGIEAELRVRAPAEVAEVPLGEVGVARDGRPARARERLGRHLGAAQVGDQHPHEPDPREPPRQALGLRTPRSESGVAGGWRIRAAFSSVSP